METHSDTTLKITIVTDQNRPTVERTNFLNIYELIALALSSTVLQIYGKLRSIHKPTNLIFHIIWHIFSIHTFRRNCWLWHCLYM